ncbi:MAG: alpha-2-macroglobulin [Pirellulaceae bacterium]|nr:MAG: alpha-2-macroglobulin [Pirellulaceae bacterium]
MASTPGAPEETITRAERDLQEGNFRDAFSALQRLVLDPSTSPETIARAFPLLRTSLHRLGEHWRVDDLLRQLVDRHPQQPLVLQIAAETILQAPHHGMVFNQQFRRGTGGRGGVHGIFINTVEQDRLLALKWLDAARQAVEAAAESASSDPVQAKILATFVDALLMGREDQHSWRLQTRTDLSAEPNYLDLALQQSYPTSRAPVDEQGHPVLYAAPESWDAAQSDGERLRWSIQRAVEQPTVAADVLMKWGTFVHGQFGVQTLAEQWWRPLTISQDEELNTGILAVHTLADEETIARLADGVRRFTLPEDYHHLPLFRRVAALGDPQLAESAHWQVVQVYLNRRQYPQAAEELKALLARFPDGNLHFSAQSLLNDIQQPRGILEPTPPAVAAQPTTMSLLFRNATRAKFTARPVDFRLLLRDFKQHVREFVPGQTRGFVGRPDISPPELSNPVSVFQDLAPNRYLSSPPITWTTDLEPRPNHWDKRVDIEHTFEQGGLYVVDAQLNNEAEDASHTIRQLVWSQEVVLVATPQASGTLFVVLDAAAGTPVAGATVELFGWRYTGDRSRRTETRELARHTDAQGKVHLALDREYQWLAVAWSAEGAPAVLSGWGGQWRGVDRGREVERQVKSFGVSDRPLYRPGETVHAQFWLAHATYGDEPSGLLKDQPVRVTVYDPRNEPIFQTETRTDNWAAVQLEVPLATTSTLGRYRVEVQGWLPSAASSRAPRQLGRRRSGLRSQQWRSVPCNLSFRVEEYRKPEFEVFLHAPEKPVALGETIKARIEAKYYFGSPVAGGTAHVRVTRAEHQANWYPPRPFDWLYGPGYWWIWSDSVWHPTWNRWHGCVAPPPPWIPERWGGPPEVVMEKIVSLNAEGQATIEIDSAQAKALFGEQYDHRYTVHVDVRDLSRRTVSGQTEIIAARQPFRIYAWTDRGHYRVGQRAEIEAWVRTPDGHPVTATGKLDLLQITYDAQRHLVERPVDSWEVATDEEGRIEHGLFLPQAGQFRARLRLIDSQGREVEGGHIFVVRGEQNTDEDWRFDALELIPDKPEYRVGDTAELLIATEHNDATVVLFVRPRDGIYPDPIVMRLQGKTASVSIDITSADQPNFFVEAYTVADGQVHVRTRNIPVPPAERALQMEIETDKASYAPGETAQVKLRLRDEEGRPVQGSVVLAAYDRSLESIGKDVMPPDIRAYFWKWKRDHHPRQMHSADNWNSSVRLRSEPAWQTLGVFGDRLADDMDLLEGRPVRKRAADNAAMRGRGMVFAQARLGGGVMMEAARGFAADDKMAVAAPMAADAVASSTEVAVRRQFADTAYWAAGVNTDADGNADFQFQWPENLTGWTLRSWAVSSGVRVATAQAHAVTRKELMVRLITPRFLVERDEVVVSAIVHNETSRPQHVEVQLEIDGAPYLELLNDAAARQVIDIDGGGMGRIDWKCRALAAGKVTLRVIARSDSLADATESTLPISVHGAEVMHSWAGTLRPRQETSQFQFTVPVDRHEETTQLIVRLSPSLALAAVDSLPSLLTIDAENNEQILNRFLPALLMHRTFRQLGIEAPHRADGTPLPNFNAQQLPGAPRNTPAIPTETVADIVFSEAAIEQLVHFGVDRLTDAQQADGGWAWFPGTYGTSSAHMTAMVVRGLLLARAHGAPVVPDAIDRGLDWLNTFQQERLRRLREPEAPQKKATSVPAPIDALVFHVLALGDRWNDEMFELLYRNRQHLGALGMTLLALSAHDRDLVEQRDMLRRNVEQFLVSDVENETAYLRLPSSAWWVWFNNDIEAMAVYLKLLAIVDPQNENASRLVKYLLNNRQHASYWRSTRDTAMVLEALNEYLRQSNEVQASGVVEVMLDGKRLQTIEFSPQDLWALDNTVEVTGRAIGSGDHVLELRRRSGSGSWYWNGYLSLFTLEEEIEPAGLEVTVHRHVYALHPTEDPIELVGVRGRPIRGSSAEFRRQRIDEQTPIAAGQLLEVELLVSGKNDYEYLMIDAPHAAGLELVDTVSGYRWEGSLFTYRQLRDDRSQFFVESLPHGQHVIRYRLRAETPGTFTALPAKIEGVYAPELRGNSADFDCQVTESRD